MKLSDRKSFHEINLEIYQDEIKIVNANKIIDEKLIYNNVCFFFVTKCYNSEN